MLMLALFVSQLYDIFWVVEKTSEYMSDDTDNGMAQLILLLVYMMIFYKLILFCLMWKASLNFEKFVKQQRELVGLR